MVVYIESVFADNTGYCSLQRSNAVKHVPKAFPSEEKRVALHCTLKVTVVIALFYFTHTASPYIHAQGAQMHN